MPRFYSRVQPSPRVRASPAYYTVIPAKAGIQGRGRASGFRRSCEGRNLDGPHTNDAPPLTLSPIPRSW